MISFPLEIIRARADQKPSGYLESVYAIGEIVGDKIQFKPDDYSRLMETYSPDVKLPQTITIAEKQPIPRDEWPAWANLISLGANDSDIGIGDTVARVIGPFGGEKFKDWYLRRFGQSCGCEQRQAEWNQLYPY